MKETKEVVKRLKKLYPISGFTIHGHEHEITVTYTDGPPLFRIEDLLHGLPVKVTRLISPETYLKLDREITVPPFLNRAMYLYNISKGKWFALKLKD